MDAPWKWDGIYLPRPSEHGDDLLRRYIAHGREESN